MAFDEIRLNDDVEQGAMGGPSFYTSVVRLSSGVESRNQNWIQQKCNYDISYGIDSKEDFLSVLAFFYARQGRARGFRFKDWSDFQATEQPCTLLTTKTFQMYNTYSDTLLTYSRKITRPVNGTVAVFVSGTLVTTGYTVDYTKGIITFGSAPSGDVTATFEFDVPVRFDTDTFSITMATIDAGEIPSLQIVELLE